MAGLSFVKLKLLLSLVIFLKYIYINIFSWLIIFLLIVNLIYTKSYISHLCIIT